MGAHRLTGVPSPPSYNAGHVLSAFNDHLATPPISLATSCSMTSASSSMTSAHHHLLGTRSAAVAPMLSCNLASHPISLCSGAGGAATMLHSRTSKSTIISLPSQPPYASSTPIDPPTHCPRPTCGRDHSCISSLHLLPRTIPLRPRQHQRCLSQFSRMLDN